MQRDAADTETLSGQLKQAMATQSGQIMALEEERAQHRSRIAELQQLLKTFQPEEEI